MLVRVEGAQSGGAVYRKVVVRNVVCTAAIIISYSITTLVIVLALLRESSETDKVRGTQIGHFEAAFLMRSLDAL